MVAPVTGRELTKYAPRGDFAPDEFRGQIQLWGHRMRWERATRCPCALVLEDGNASNRVVSRAGRIDCPNGCRGTGYLYGEPQEVKALVNDSSADKRFLQAFGEIAFGSVRLSMLPEHLPAWRDRLTDLDGIRIVQAETRVRQATIEALTYPIVNRDMLVGQEGNPSSPEIRTLGVREIRVAGPDGILLDVRPEEGIDFEITPEGWVRFLGDFAAGILTLSGTPGTQVPAGTVFFLEREDSPTRRYATDEDAAIGMGGNVTVGATCLDTGTIGNLSGAVKLAQETPIAGLEEIERVSGFSDGADTPNPIKLGQRYAFTHATFPVYVIRSEPHLYRHTYVAQKPFVNAVDGYRGAWAPGLGAFPADSVEAPGDYFEVYQDGELDGLTFVEGDVLVAIVSSPPADSATGWAKISDAGGPAPSVLVPMTVMSLAWLEDLGDPFDRTASR